MHVVHVFKKYIDEDRYSLTHKCTPSVVTLGLMNGRIVNIILFHFLQFGQLGHCHIPGGWKAL